MSPVTARNDEFLLFSGPSNTFSGFGSTWIPNCRLLPGLFAETETPEAHP